MPEQTWFEIVGTRSKSDSQAETRSVRLAIAVNSLDSEDKPRSAKDKKQIANDFINLVLPDFKPEPGLELKTIGKPDDRELIKIVDATSFYDVRAYELAN